MSDSPKKFAADLRRLRLAGGGSTYEALARSTGLSRSTIADAFSGKRLPSERTLFALAEAMGGDPGEWLTRRTRISRDGGASLLPDETRGDVLRDSAHLVPPTEEGASTGTTADADIDADAGTSLDIDPNATIGAFAVAGDVHVMPTVPLPVTEDPLVEEPRRRGVGASVLIPLLLLVAVLGFVAGHLWWPQPGPPAGALPGASVLPATGEDILDAGCTLDARPVGSETRDFDTQLQVMFSPACNAVWGQLYRYDGNAYGNSIRVIIGPRRDGVDPGPAQEASAEDAQYALTTIIVQNDVTDQFCAQGWVTDDGTEVSVGEPVCG